MHIEISNEMSFCLVGSSLDSCTTLKRSLEKMQLRAVTLFERGADLISYLRDFEPHMVFLLGDPSDMHWASLVRMIRTTAGLAIVPTVYLRVKGEKLSPEEDKLLKVYRVQDGGELPLSPDRLSGIITRTVSESLDKSSVPNRLNAAAKLVREGLLNRARQVYESVAESQPENIVALTGLIQTSVHDSAATWRQLEAVLTLDPANHNFKFEMVNHYLKEGETAKMNLLFDEVLEEIKSDADAFWLKQLGSISISLRLFHFCETVVKDMRKSPALAASGEPDLLMARAFLGSGNQDEAQKYMKKALASAANKTPEMLNLLGILAKREGRIAEAIAFYKMALVLSPHDFRLAYNIALALLDIKDYQSAHDYLVKALSIRSDFTKAQTKLSEVKLLLTPKVS